MISLPTSITWLIFVIYLPFVLSCNVCTSTTCPAGRTCVSTDCSTTVCGTDRPFDIFLECPPVVDPPSTSACTPGPCTDGDLNCYKQAMYQSILSIASASSLKNQWVINTPTPADQPRDQPGLKWTFVATVWALPGDSQFSTPSSVAQNLLLYLNTMDNTLCAQIHGDTVCAAYMGQSDTTLLTSPTILNVQTCPDGTLIDADASIQSCPQSNTSTGKRIITIILPIIAGFTVLFLIIATCIAIHRYRTKQIPPEQGTELKSTSQPSQV